MILHGGADVRGWQPRAAAAHAGFQVAADVSIHADRAIE
jgi:hypothetical protein